MGPQRSMEHPRVHCCLEVQPHPEKDEGGGEEPGAPCVARNSSLLPPQPGLQALPSSGVASGQLDQSSAARRASPRLDRSSAARRAWDPAPKLCHEVLPPLTAQACRKPRTLPPKRLASGTRRRSGACPGEGRTCKDRNPEPSVQADSPKAALGTLQGSSEDCVHLFGGDRSQARRLRELGCRGWSRWSRAAEGSFRRSQEEGRHRGGDRE